MSSRYGMQILSIVVTSVSGAFSLTFFSSLSCYYTQDGCTAFSLLWFVSLSLSASRCWTHQCDTFSSMSNLNGKQETRKRDRYNFWWKIAVDAIFLRNVRLMRNGSYSVQSSKNKWFNGKIVLTEKMIFLWDIFIADFTSWSSFVVFFFYVGVKYKNHGIVGLVMVNL